MSNELAAANLTETPSSAEVTKIFYLGLLNQQLEGYHNWTIARDTFRALRSHNQVSTAQQQLAGILEDYNQSRINWYQRHSNLVREYKILQILLTNSEDEKLVLEQKIQALKDLEEAISTRREQ